MRCTKAKKKLQMVKKTEAVHVEQVKVDVDVRTHPSGPPSSFARPEPEAGLCRCLPQTLDGPAARSRWPRGRGRCNGRRDQT